MAGMRSVTIAQHIKLFRMVPISLLLLLGIVLPLAKIKARKNRPNHLLFAHHEEPVCPLNKSLAPRATILVTPLSMSPLGLKSSMTMSRAP